MARLDLILFWGFLTLTLAGLGWTWYAFYKAFKGTTPRTDPDGIKMFFWAVGGLVGLIIAGMSAAYILVPIISHYFFSAGE